MLCAAERKTVIQQFQRSPADVGSTEVQIAILSAKIRDLQGHIAIHKKDLHSLRGLMNFVQQRRSLLKYLKRKNLDLYRKIVTDLKIRD